MSIINIKNIKDFPEYTIDINGIIKNSKQAIIKPFDVNFVDLYRDEGKTIISKKDNTKISVKTPYRKMITEIVIEHFMLKDYEVLSKYMIKYIDHNQMNCAVDNIKLRPITYFYYKTLGFLLEHHF